MNNNPSSNQIQFIYEEDEEVDARLKNKYDMLYKEYCIADLSRYKEGK
jgi:hypothetical protein